LRNNILKLLSTVPNQLTAARLVLVFVMWLLAWWKLPVYIGIGTFISFVTDVLDGYVARKLNQVSKLGSQFDSLVDHFLLPSALYWLWLFSPEVFMENTGICILAVVLYFSSMLLGVIKFRRIGNLHLYSSKASAVAMFLFFSHTLITGEYNAIFFYITSLMFIVSLMERLVVQLLFSQVTEHMGSVLLAWRDKPLNPIKE
jgi:cardiolipin synthase (CMP-forming)